MLYEMGAGADGHITPELISLLLLLLLRGCTGVQLPLCFLSPQVKYSSTAALDWLKENEHNITQTKHTLFSACSSRFSPLVLFIQVKEPRMSDTDSVHI